MKDIGLGILDPYTVAIVLITLVLAQVVFGYQIPLDSTNATQLFISLVLFTGYIYAARSLVRLPIAAIRATILVNNSFRVSHDSKSDKNVFKRIKRMFTNLLDSIRHLPLILGYWLLINLEFSSDRFPLRVNFFVRYALAILDRISLILITALAIMPEFQKQFQSVAIAGLVLMMFIFVLKGDFSALLADSLARTSPSKVDEDVSLPETESDLQTSAKRSAAAKAFQKQAEEAKASLKWNRNSSVETEVKDGKNNF